MVRTYPNIRAKTKKCEIPQTTLIEIGKIVRACAEIEDLVGLYICRLTRTEEWASMVLIGKVPISKKLEIAEHFARRAGAEEKKLHAKLFNPLFDEMLECRNVLAHGIFLGSIRGGKLAFLTARTNTPQRKRSTRVVFAYTEDEIRLFADLSEILIPKFEKSLKLSAWRERRSQQPLLPHQKAQPRRKRSGKPQAQPPSSQGK